MVDMYGGINIRMETKPYTYHLFLPIKNLHYYGVSYKKGCCPEDLWVTYFSSSKRVKGLIYEFSKNAFEYEIRKLFPNREEALLWESQVLRRLHVSTNKNWINISENNPLFATPKELHERWKQKIKCSMNTIEMKEHLRQKAIEQFQDPIKKENHRRGRIGPKNPAFGKIWIHNENNEHKRVTIETMNTYIELGWSEGRIFSPSHNVSLKIDFSSRPKDPITHKLLKRGEVS